MRFDRLKRVSNCLVGTSSILGSAILPSCTEVKADSPVEDYNRVCLEFTKDRYYWLYYLLQWSFLGSLLKRSIFNKISEREYKKDLKTLCKDAVMSLFSGCFEDYEFLANMWGSWHLDLKKEVDDTSGACTVTLLNDSREILSYNSNGSDYFEQADRLIKAYRQLKNADKLCKTLKMDLTKVRWEHDDDYNWLFDLRGIGSDISYKGKNLVGIYFVRKVDVLPTVYCVFERKDGREMSQLAESEFDTINELLKKKLSDTSKKGISISDFDDDRVKDLLVID